MIELVFKMDIGVFRIVSFFLKLLVILVLL